MEHHKFFIHFYFYLSQFRRQVFVNVFVSIFPVLWMWWIGTYFYSLPLFFLTINLEGKIVLHIFLSALYLILEISALIIYILWSVSFRSSDCIQFGWSVIHSKPGFLHWISILHTCKYCKKTCYWLCVFAYLTLFYQLHRTKCWIWNNSGLWVMSLERTWPVIRPWGTKEECLRQVSRPLFQH